MSTVALSLQLDVFVGSFNNQQSFLFINKGDHFDDEADTRGVLIFGDHFGMTFGDVNGDGLVSV